MIPLGPTEKPFVSLQRTMLQLRTAADVQHQLLCIREQHESKDTWGMCESVSCWCGSPLVGCSWPSGSLFPQSNMGLQSLTISLLPAYILLSSGVYLGRCFFRCGNELQLTAQAGPRGINVSSQHNNEFRNQGKAASKSRDSWLIGYWDQKGKLAIISSLSGPKEDVHIALGASMLEERKKERKLCCKQDFQR